MCAFASEKQDIRFTQNRIQKARGILNNNGAAFCPALFHKLRHARIRPRLLRRTLPRLRVPRSMRQRAPLSPLQRRYSCPRRHWFIHSIFRYHAGFCICRIRQRNARLRQDTSEHLICLSRFSKTFKTGRTSFGLFQTGGIS